MPGANQYVVSGLMVQSCARTLPLSSPAGMTTAPFGGDEGPRPRIALLPHTRTGGDAWDPETDAMSRRRPDRRSAAEGAEEPQRGSASEASADYSGR